jgi:hypothetical protein
MARDAAFDERMAGANFAKWGTEIDRVRGWSKEMEAGESVFPARTTNCETGDCGHSSSMLLNPLESWKIIIFPQLHFLVPRVLQQSTSNRRGKKARDQRSKDGYSFEPFLANRRGRRGFAAGFMLRMAYLVGLFKVPSLAELKRARKSASYCAM